MALVLCPECRAEVSDRATQCPKCGYPLAAPVGLPATPTKAPRLRTLISIRFAAVWTGATVVAWTILMGIGSEPNNEEAVVIFGSLAALASLVPIWWKTRRAARDAAMPNTAELERRIEEHLKEAEARIGRQLGELEDNARQMLDLEERLEFTERLLTRYRDEQLGSPPGPQK